MAKFVDITLRIAKGTPLSYLEMDNNLEHLQQATAPIGTIFTYAASTDLPTTWLECNGASLATATYADLYSIIGNTYGGDASNFNLPDLRGQFIRGWDNGAGNDPEDPARVFGSSQDDDFKSHSHSSAKMEYMDGQGGGNTSLYAEYGGNALGVPLLNTGGAETRPKNIALMYIIKASIS